MRQFTSLLTIAALALLLLLPAGAEEPDYQTVYEPILASAADLLTCQNPSDHIPGPGETGIQENRIGVDPEEALQNVGYTIQDLSGDGIPELIIVQADLQDPARSSGKQILAVFNCIQGTPSLCFEGWARNRYYLLPNNTLLNQGSSGAAYSCLGLYQLDSSATELSCLDFFFTWAEDDQVVTYHNTDGVWDVPHEGNQRVDLDFERMAEILEADIQTLSIISFAQYQQEAHASTLQPLWYPYDPPEELRLVTLSTEEYSTQIALCAFHGSVTDVELLSLELEDIDEQGQASFRKTLLETIPILEPGKPVVVQLSFGCTIPNFGIRYTDDTGVTRAYSLTQSGMDGSLLMNEMA